MIHPRLENLYEALFDFVIDQSEAADTTEEWEDASAALLNILQLGVILGYRRQDKLDEMIELWRDEGMEITCEWKDKLH